MDHANADGLAYHAQMPDPLTTRATPSYEYAFEAYGVRVGFVTNDATVLRRLRAFVPPESSPCEPADVEQHFGLIADDDGYHLRMNEEWTVDYQDLELALGLLDTHLTGYVAVHASERIFVHSGAVAHNGRLLLVPGMSLSGKSTLVAALLGAGATYYSDDFALLDEQGRVHPYPKPLSLRGRNLDQTTHTAESLGAVVGVEPLRPSLIVMSTYQPGMAWQPRQLSAGEGVLAMLSNTVPARERPAESLAAIKRAVEGAVVLDGARGEADDTSAPLLARLDAT